MRILRWKLSLPQSIVTSGLFALVFQPVLVGDLYGYLVYGDWMLSQGQITRFDTFSFTVRGLEWINHEWLFEIGLRLMFEWFGWAGLLGLQALLVAGILFLVAGVCNERTGDFWSWFLSLIVPVLALVPGLTLRPQLFTYLFVLLLVVLLSRNRSPGWTDGLCLMMLFIVWSNLHGGVVVGLAFLGFFLVDQVVGRSKPEGLTRSVTIYAGCLLVTLVNPYGIELWSMVFETVADPLTTVFIEEWQPTWSHPYHMAVWSLLGFQWVIPLLVSSEPYDRRTVLRSLALAAAGFLSLWPRRNLSYYGLAVAVFALPMPRRWIPGLDFSETIKNGLSIGVATGAMFLVGLTVSEGFYVSKDPYPEPLMDDLQTSSRGRTNVLVYYPWAQWALFRDSSIRVFLDGRWKTVYPEDVIRDYGRLLVGDAKVLSKYRIDWVLLPERYHLNRVLFESNAWKVSSRHRGTLLWKHRPEEESS